MMHLKTRLTGDERGSALIEMALAAPLLAAFLIGMIDLSRAYSTKLLLEQAAQRTIEKIQRDGYVNSDEYKTELKADAAGGASVDASAVTVTPWLECNNNGVKKDIGSTCADGEPYARYVVIGLTKTYTPLFKMKFAGAKADGTYTVRASAGVRVQ